MEFNPEKCEVLKIHRKMKPAHLPIGSGPKRPQTRKARTKKAEPKRPQT